MTEGVNAIAEDELLEICFDADECVAEFAPLISAEYEPVMEVLRDALDIAGDNHADECAINVFTDSDSLIYDCNCWVSRAQEIVGEG